MVVIGGYCSGNCFWVPWLADYCSWDCSTSCSCDCSCLCCVQLLLRLLLSCLVLIDQQSSQIFSLSKGHRKCAKRKSRGWGETKPYESSTSWRAFQANVQASTCLATKACSNLHAALLGGLKGVKGRATTNARPFKAASKLVQMYI